MVKSNITFTEDIIKEVAEEFGITEDEAMQVYKNEVRYIRHQMEEDNTCAVMIPFIGTMHVNKGLLYKSLKAQERSRDKGHNIDLEKYEKNLKRMEAIKELEIKRKEEGAKGSTSHTKRTILKKLQKKTGKSLDEIEQIQKEVNGKD